MNDFGLIVAPLCFDCRKSSAECQVEFIDLLCILSVKETFEN